MQWVCFRVLTGHGEMIYDIIASRCVESYLAKELNLKECLRSLDGKLDI